MGSGSVSHSETEDPTLCPHFSKKLLRTIVNCSQGKFIISNVGIEGEKR